MADPAVSLPDFPVPSLADAVGPAAVAPFQASPVQPSGADTATPVTAAQQTYPGLKRPPPPIGATINGLTYMGGDPRSTSQTVWKPATGDAYLNSMPLSDDKKTLIKMMANYEAPASGTRGIGSPEVQQLVGFAKQYDPTFNVMNYKVRQDYLHDLNDQKANGTIQALNNAALHAQSFDEEFQKLNNSNWLPQWANRGLDYVGTQATQKAAGAANETAAVLAPEIAKVAQGAAPTVGEVDAQANNIDIGARPNIENGTMASMAQKIGDRMMSMQQQYRRAFGNQVPKEPLMTPEAAMAAHQLLQRYSPGYESKLDYNTLTAGGFNPAQAKQIVATAPSTPKASAPMTPQSLPRISAPNVIRYDPQGNRVAQ